MPITVRAVAPHNFGVIGALWIRAASRIVQGTARTPIGCTTVTGARSSAVTWSAAPTPVRARPPSQRGFFTTVSNCRPLSFSPPGVAASPTARCCTTEATARAIEASTVNATARPMFWVTAGSFQNVQMSGTSKTATTRNSSNSGSPSFQ